MRQIRKGKVPKMLTKYRKTKGATYKGFQTAARMKELRTSLVKEQGGICCYCMQRIRPEAGKMKVEHFRSQTRFPLEQLVYSNMLGACLGNEGQPKDEQHCDTSKGKKSVCRNPARAGDRIESFVNYLGDGTLTSDDKRLNRELGKAVLNLNRPLLVKNRVSVLDSFKRALPRNRDLKKAELEKMEKDWGAGASAIELRPYCGVVVYWVRKRLKRSRK